MKKVLVMLMAAMMAFSTLSASAIPTVVGTVESVQEVEEYATEKNFDEDTVLAAETVVPAKYDSTYGELVMYSDFSGDDVATPTYSASNMKIYALVAGTAPDGTVCAVSSGNLSGARGIQIDTADKSVFAYEDGTAMSGKITYFVELCVQFDDVNLTQSGYFFTSAPEDWEPFAPNQTGVKDNKRFTKSGVWATTKALSHNITSTYNVWKLVMNKTDQPVYFRKVSVYVKDGNAVIFKASSSDNYNIKRFVPQDTFTFPGFDDCFSGEFTGYSWTDGTTYYAPGQEVSASAVAGKIFYPEVDKNSLNDEYGYRLTSWDFKSTGEIWQSSDNSTAFSHPEKGQLLLRITNGSKVANVIADPVDSSNLVLSIPKSQTNADFIGINSQLSSGASNVSYEVKGQYTITYRVYLDQADSTSIHSDINGVTDTTIELTPYKWTQCVLQRNREKFTSIQLYRGEDTVYYDNISVWCYPSDALILRSAVGSAVAEMVYADETEVFPAEFNGVEVSAWTDGSAVYKAGAVIPAEACLKTWVPCDASALNAPVSLNKYSIRTNDTTGMRFASFAGERIKSEATEYGFIVTAASFLGDNDYTSLVFPKEKEGSTAIAAGSTGSGTVKIGDLDVKYVYANAYVKDSGLDNFRIYTHNGEDGFLYNAVLVDIKEAQYKVEYLVRPYIVIDGVYYYGAPMVKDIFSVAQEYDGPENEIINSILGK